MKPVRTHTFNGVKYLVTIDRLDGLCSTHKLEREIIILADLDTRAGLETAVHEALHACCWSKGEDKVTITAKDLARFLWRLGWRRIKGK